MKCYCGFCVFVFRKILYFDGKCFFVGAAAGRESLSRAPALADIPVGSCADGTLEPGRCQISLQGSNTQLQKRFSNDRLKVHLKVFQRCGFEGEDGGA